MVNLQEQIHFGYEPNENDKEFIKYRQFIENLKRQCKS